MHEVREGLRPRERESGVEWGETGRWRRLIPTSYPSWFQNKLPLWSMNRRRATHWFLCIYTYDIFVCTCIWMPKVAVWCLF